MKVLLSLLAALAAFAADDPWAKVRELKGGVELRIFKRDARQPVLARMDELTEENLLVVLKNEQVAIPRDQIDRIDYRPPQKGSRVTRESKVTQDPPVNREGKPGGTSVSSGLSIGSKPDFETVYRRTAAPPQK